MTPQSHRAYRLLMRLGPARLRERHGVEMEALFAQRLNDARQRSVVAVAVAWRWRWVRRIAAGLAVCMLAWALADALQA